MSQLIFNKETGFEAPETEAIRKEVAKDWVDAFFAPDLPILNTEPSSPAGQLIDSEVAEIEAKNAALLHLSNMFNPKISVGRWQDALGAIYFLTRKIDEPTIVTCQLTGRRGTIIPYGALISSSNGYTLICNKSTSIADDGLAETTFRVSENGPIEISAGTVNSITTTIPGWDTVINEAAGAIGRARESRSEFEERRARSVALNAHGSIGSLYGTIANISGVLDVAVLENISPEDMVKFGVIVPAHGITICVYGGDDKDIARAIYSKKDNGCNTGGNTEITHIATDYSNAVYEYNILRPEPVNFWIKVKLGKGILLTDSQISALKSALYNNFYGLDEKTEQGRIGLATTIFASRFYSPALLVDGIRSIQNIQVALAKSAPNPDAYTDVISINGDQEPVLALSNISIDME